MTQIEMETMYAVQSYCKRQGKVDKNMFVMNAAKDIFCSFIASGSLRHFDEPDIVNGSVRLAHLLYDKLTDKNETL